jgi:rod shape-determining protein MreC
VAGDRRSPSRSRLTLLLLVLLSVTLLTLDGRDAGPFGALRSGVSSALAPVGNVVGAVFRPIGAAWGNLADGNGLRAQNEQLQERIEELESAAAEAEAARRELAQLAADLDLEVVALVDTVVARVVSGGVTNFDNTIAVNRGSNQGIRVGMPVVGGGGLVGRVIEVSGSRSTIQLVTDPSSRVGVRVAAGSGLGVLQGQGSENRALATSFDRSISLAEGDLLVTSGAERSVFPPDIAVGRVLSVSEDPVGLQKEAEVELSAPFSDLRYVTVLLWEPPR